MSNTIRFIEMVGRGPAIGAAAWRYGQALETSGLDADLLQALRDARADLGDLLQARPTMICMISTPDGGESESTEDVPLDAPPVEDVPDDEESEKS